MSLPEVAAEASWAAAAAAAAAACCEAAAELVVAAEEETEALLTSTKVVATGEVDGEIPLFLIGNKL